MITTNGVYNGLTLTFNQEHNGYFGAIVSGLAGGASLNLPQQPKGDGEPEQNSDIIDAGGGSMIDGEGGGYTPVDPSLGNIVAG